jgi:hypothetical protein
MFIFVVECMGISAVLPYALLQVASTRPTGSSGLPADDGISIGDKIFKINVLVPCYSEGLDVSHTPLAWRILPASMTDTPARCCAWLWAACCALVLPHLPRAAVRGRVCALLGSCLVPADTWYLRA